MKRPISTMVMACLCFSLTGLQAQLRTDTATLKEGTLDNCIQYALQHQPLIQQSLLDEAIVDKQVQAKLADWYPQLNFNYNYSHSFDLPVAYFSNIYVRTGTFNSSNLGLNLSQNIFNRDVLLASRTAKDVRTQVKQNTSFNKIELAVGVSKAFYDVLLTQQQVWVLNEAIVRLERSLKDALSQYRSGVADKTDYKRATIALNNAKAQQKQSTDLVTAKLSYLKQLMGLQDSANLQLQYDTSMMEKDALTDTAAPVQYDNRIEYRLLQTQQRLQQANLQYQRSAFVPSVSAFGNYNVSYLNNEFSKTYSNGFGNSNIGLQLSFPIFQGNKRVLQVRQAELQTKRTDWDMVLLKSRINTQYAQALALYKGNLANYTAQKENVALARDVYQTLDLQYRSGIRTYLDVIIAESDLRTAQLNYYNALYQLLQSKLDVEKALGNIQY
jgi:outer membrane protein TolC